MARRRRPPRSGAISELPPLKILSQIAALQAVYYAAALALTLFASLVAGTAFSLDLVFSWQAVRGDTTQGWVWAFLWVLDGGLFTYVSFPTRSPPFPHGLSSPPCLLFWLVCTMANFVGMQTGQ